MAYSFTRGETIILALRNIDGAAVTSVTAKAKALIQAVPSGEVLFTFDVSAQQDLGNARDGTPLGQGWVLTAPPSVSSGLTPGTYGTDARLVLDSGLVEISPVQPFTITAGITETA